MKLVKPVGLSEFTPETTMVIGSTLVNFVHYDRETLEFSFERLLSHIDSGNNYEIIVLTKEQVEERLNDITFIQGVK